MTGPGDEPSDSGSAAVPQPDPAPETDPVLETDPARSEAQQAGRREHRHPWLRRGTIATASVLVVLLVAGVTAYFKLNSNITTVDVSGLLGQRPQQAVTASKLTNLTPVNILVMGLDTRDLGTNEFGKAQNFPGARPDTTMIVHLAADRRSAVVVSIPRDSMTQAPRNCKDPSSKVSDGPIRQINANFGLGGPACVIRTVEGLTDIRIDHFMVVNFLGFQSMVDALGSVEVCLPEAVNDPKSKLKLPAGRSLVNGEQALAFVRVRKNIGSDGSDLLRIHRQQAFLSSMVQEATSSNLLLRPDRLFRFLDAATKSLTTDPGIGNLNALREVAQSVGGLKSSQVRFVTVPVEAYPADPMRVQWTADAKVLWKSIHDDAPLPGAKRAPGPKPTPTPTPTAELTVAPDKITVQVTNGSGVPGIAKQAADDLRLQGFTVKASLSASSIGQGVTVGYSSGNGDEAATVAAAFPGAALVIDESAGDVIQVSMGAGSPNVVEVPNRTGSTPLPTHTLTAELASTPSSGVTIKARTANTDACS